MSRPEYILALDYGEKRIGVAIAHQVARLPRPLTTLANGPNTLGMIAELVEREQVALVVVGLPRGMDGGYTAQTRAAEAFRQTLTTKLSVPVVLADETLTSVDAVTHLPAKHTKEAVDALAASLILERYLAEQTAHRGNDELQTL